jgi:hypothetical protein
MMNVYKVLIRRLEGKNNSGNLDVNGWIIIK